jgi:hypothetical protein
MKQNIPLGTYTKIRCTYIPLIDSTGTCCDNCGRLIANIVTVKHEAGKHFTIGQDCAKTLFSKQENEVINSEIKADKRRQENEVKAAAMKIRMDALNYFLKATAAAGISNENINTPEARQIYNSILNEHNLKAGFQITFPH